MDALTNGVTIKVGDSTYHSFTDFGLAIGNTNYIEAPEYDTYYVNVPGRDGFLDLSETIAGRVIYRQRKISIEFGGKGECNEWDAKMSDIRNKFHGKTVQLIFDNDPEWYWTGRADINDYDRFQNMGTFKFEIPQADPFKYKVTAQELNWSLTSSYVSKDAPASAIAVCPEFTVAGIIDSYTVDVRIASGYPGYGWSKSIGSNGTYRFPELLITSATRFQARKLSTSGATLKISYRQASL